MCHRTLHEGIAFHVLGSTHGREPTFIAEPAFSQRGAREQPHVTAYRNQIWALLERCTLKLEPPARHEIVGVEAGDQRRSTSCEPGLQGRDDPAMLARDDAHTLVCECKRGRDLACVVRRAIVDHDAFPIALRLSL